MKIKNIIASIALSATLVGGVLAGVSLNQKANEAKAANNSWESLTLYYAATSTISGRISVNRGGVPSGSSQWEDEDMTYTSRKCGSYYVYTATVWEYYGGFDDIYFKNGDTVLHHISGWTPRDTMSGKMYNGSSWDTIYTVDFNANGHGTAPDGQFAVSGGKVTQPSNPTQSGYTFGGWYKEADCINAWNFSTDTVTSNITLYAKWTNAVYNIAYYDEGGDPFSGTHESGYPTTHTYGSSTLLKGATKPNYYFGGWHTTYQCTEGSRITILNGYYWTFDIRLYAKWTQITQYTVSKYAVVDGVNQGLIDSEQVEEGTGYSVPEKIYRPNCSFIGWYTDSACTSAYSGSTINANLDLYAKYTSSVWSGTIHVDLKDTWYDAAANYAVLFMDKTTYSSEISAWSTYTTGILTGDRLVNISYNIPFEPLEMTLVRYNSSYTEGQWNTTKFPEDGNKWGQTPDVSFSEVIRVGTTTIEGKNVVYSGYPKVCRWNPSDSDIYLNAVKMNGNRHAEYYSTSITLATNQEFKIQIAPYESGDYSGNYSTHDSLKSSFTGGGSSNIKCLTGGTYAFYFDSTNNSTFITKVEIAEADEWAQYFLANVGCDATGRNLPTGWSSCATEYGKLSGAAKDIVYGATASEGGTYVEQAVARYDVAVKNHPSLTKFIVNSGDTPRSAAIANVSSIFRSSETSNTILIVVIFSSIALTSIGGYFFLRHRKEN